MNNHLFDTTDPSVIVVSKSGNDDRGKGSFTNPVKTLTHALADAIGPSTLLGTKPRQ